METQAGDPARLFLNAAGIVPALMREMDWSKTSLGPIDDWPEGLRTAVSICINSPFPMGIYWGEAFVFIYNDAAIPVIGDKHPAGLGMPGAKVWAEIWPTIGPRLSTVLTARLSTIDEDLLLSLRRRGFVEECYFTFSYSPIVLNNGAAGGAFAVWLETTERVIKERRLRMLSRLAAVVTQRNDLTRTLPLMEDVLAEDEHGLPCFALYLSQEDESSLRRKICSKHPGDDRIFEESIPLGSGGDADHPVVSAAQQHEAVVIAAGGTVYQHLQNRSWPLHVAELCLMPFRLPGVDQFGGVLVVGLNSRKRYDAEYASYIHLIAGHIVTAIVNAEAMEAQRRHVEAMAQLDKAKSQFLANASHELRTPVSLILGPLEEVLESGKDTLPADMHARLDVVHRSARRLQKLVTGILDFSTIEAGMMDVLRKPTDIRALTADIVSLFRSAAESAGVVLSLTCRPDLPVVLLDPDAWEKILMNLLSNAVKFTLQGRIDVHLSASAGHLLLEVNDTGVGIAPEDLPHLFGRFYRSRSARGRSVEGNGIGLALVQEIAHLHGGEARVQSLLNQGSCFSVCIPLELAHRGSGVSQEASSSPNVPMQASNLRLAYVDELERIVARSTRGHQAAPSPESGGGGAIRSSLPKVLIVDDNEDFANYIVRLMGPSFRALTAPDGVQGLERAKTESPDLILMDVMMPGMDGFQLLRSIRADETLRSVPIIMLSAKAGEEARIEALSNGADDYLVKPFNARELLARAQGQISMANLRRETFERETALLQEIRNTELKLEMVLEGTNEIFVQYDADLRVVGCNDTALRLAGSTKAEVIGRHVAELTPGFREDLPTIAALKIAMQERKATICEYFHPPSQRTFDVRFYPIPTGVLGFGTDVTEQKRAENSLRALHSELELLVADRTRELEQVSRLFRAIFDHAPQGIAIADTDGRFVRANAAYHSMIGYSEAQMQQCSIKDLADPDGYAAERRLLQELMLGKRASFMLEMQYKKADDSRIWVRNFVSLLSDEAGAPRYFVRITQDVTEAKAAEAQILESQLKLRKLYDQLQNVRRDERLALAREVHDQLGQVLSAAKIDIKLLEESAADPKRTVTGDELLVELRSARTSIDLAIEKVRQIADDLRAPEIPEQGLFVALSWHARDFERRTRIRCVLDLPSDVRPPNGALALTMFRVFQESLTNVLRHAQSQQVNVSIVRRGNHMLLRLHDDGIGIPRFAARSQHSIGIQGMRERAALAQGRLFIRALASGGTLVSLRVPLAIGPDGLSQNASREQ